MSKKKKNVKPPATRGAAAEGVPAPAAEAPAADEPLVFAIGKDRLDEFMERLLQVPPPTR